MTDDFVERLRLLLKKDCRKLILNNKLNQDLLFNKKYYEKKENRVAFYTKQTKVDNSTKVTRFFDALEKTFSHQKAFSINVKNLLLKITDDNELELQAITEIKQKRKQDIEDTARILLSEEEQKNK